MNNDIHDAILRLGGNRNLTLHAGSGGCVHVHWGQVWITRQGDSKDHIVGSGESLAIGRSGATVLTAINDAGVSLMERCKSVTGPETAGTLKSTNAQNGDDGGQAFVLGRVLPSFEQIDHHLARAKQLRARFVGKLLRGEWRSTHRASNGANSNGASNGAHVTGANDAVACGA